jgi:RNA polymerase sigma-70 factor (ECF subfamily)
VRDHGTADEVVQDAWISIIRSLATFEKRSSLRTWMATIVLNRAKTTAARHARTISVGSLGSDLEEEESVLDPKCFGSVGFWARPPSEWNQGTPEALVHQRQVLEAVGKILDELPENQRAVLSLRDLEGWAGEEVCNALGISESNQRVLLHRARAKVRAALASVLGPESSS